MRIQVLNDADAVAREAAKIIAAEARDTVAARGRFIMAVSGGHTPWQMLRALANENVPWKGVHLVQVDERIAPAGDPDRNLTHLRESLLEYSPLAEEQIHAMPVEEAEKTRWCWLTERQRRNCNERIYPRWSRHSNQKGEFHD